jgi:conjugal transfer pilus assembly protein TraW
MRPRFPLRAAFLPALATVLLVTLVSPTAGIAKDYGRQGEVFPVIEPDMLTMIEAKLRGAQASGKMAAMNKELARRTEARVRRPTPVAGIVTAAKARSWTYDPTITISEDIRDNKGALIIPAGRRINPLDTVGLRQSLVFLNGDDPAQVAWALKSTTQLNAKLILTSGSPFVRMKAAQRRFYFDQGGQLTGKFGIKAVPAVVEQDGRVLKVTEVVVPPLRGKAGAS